MGRRMVRPRERGNARPRHRARMHGERGVCTEPIGGGEAVAIKAAAPSVRAMAAPARIQSRAAG